MSRSQHQHIERQRITGVMPKRIQPLHTHKPRPREARPSAERGVMICDKCKRALKPETKTDSSGRVHTMAIACQHCLSRAAEDRRQRRPARPAQVSLILRPIWILRHIDGVNRA